MTDKLDPVDVDLAVRSDIWDDTSFVAALSKAYPGEEQFIDVYFNTTSSPQHMEDLFQDVQGSATRKGIVLLTP